MIDESQGCLGHVFPHVDVLSASVRAELSELLAVPGRIPAVRAQAIGELPLPTTDRARRAVRLAIKRGLDASSLATVQALALSDLVPPVRALEGGPVAGCPARLSRLLSRQGVTTWADLGALTLTEIARWAHVGPQTLVVLVGLAVDAALAPAARPEEEPHQAEAAAMALLLQHDRAAGGNLRRALEEHASSDGPPEVRLAAARLLAAAGGAGDPRLSLLERVWMAAGDHRDRAVLAHRALVLDASTSAKELAANLGISDARVGQIQARAERRALDMAAACGEAVETMATDLRARIGPVARLAAVDDALGALGLPAHDDPRTALLVWLAGPYAPVSGHPTWVATDPADLLAGTRRFLHEDGGVRQLDHVAADLEAAGIAAPDVADWLRAQPAALVDGLVVALSGSPVDVAERILSATGRAMAATDLAATMSRPDAAPSLENRLGRDPRFVRVDPHRFELAEWGSEAFVNSPPPVATELFPAAGRGRTPAGTSQLRIEVDAAVLRGASHPVPLSVVEALGVPCGGRRSFATRFGPVALTHKPAQPTHGSIRPVALAVGAIEGDTLVLEFDAATGDASVELVVASRSAAS